MTKVAIQGEPGSNSHMASLQMLGEETFTLLACTASADVFDLLASGGADYAVLPIENSLHGSVFEHYDLLLAYPVSVVAEMLLPVRHNVIAAPGVRLEELRQVLSHPVALSQCRNWLRAHPAIEAVPTYDTAGSVKQLMERGRRDVAGIAPALAASQYGAAVLVENIEDHPENYTRFYKLVRGRSTGPAHPVDKMSLAFSLEHRPGTLIEALDVLRRAAINLTKIESRPVPGCPWEYVFFVDIRFPEALLIEPVLAELGTRCVMLRELGRYRGAANLSSSP